MRDTAFVPLYVGRKRILITELIALLMYSKCNENQKCKENTIPNAKCFLRYSIERNIAAMYL